MKDEILNFPSQFKKGIESAKEVKIKAPFEKVIICGMGGSALAGSFLIGAFDDIKFPVYLHRDYNLPFQADKKSLIITISFSGNTEETLSAFLEAKKKNYQLIVITSGGKLKELCQKERIPLVLIPHNNLQPRQALGIIFSALVKVLENCSFLSKKTEELLRVAEKLKPSTLEEKGKKLAERIGEKIPIIYSSRKFQVLARIWKIKFNENSKIMSFWNYFPELNHNEMVAYSNLVPSQRKKAKDFFVIILKDNKDNPRILKRIELTKKIIEKAKIETEIVELEGNTNLEKLFNSVILSDWISFYLAKKFGVCPQKVEIIQEFKKSLKDEPEWRNW